MQFDCGTRILRVIHGRDARATFANRISTAGWVSPDCRRRERGRPVRTARRARSNDNTNSM